MIYENLVTSSTTIKVCFDLKTAKVYLRLYNNGKGDIAVDFLCDAVGRSAIASEVYEVFFKHNTFECGDCEILEHFLLARKTALDIWKPQYGQRRIFSSVSYAQSRVGEPYQPLQRKQLIFRKTPWLRSLKIALHCDDQESNYTAEQQLSLVLELPRLQRVEIWIYGFCVKPNKFNSVDLKVAEIAEVCKEIREKVGARLTVRVLKSWLAVCHSRQQHYLYENAAVKWEDVSWIWEPLDEAARLRVERGVATHRDYMKVMVSKKYPSHTNQIDCFGQHWQEDHREQQEIAKTKAAAAKTEAQGS